MNWQSVDFGSVCRLVNGKAYNEKDWSTTGTPIVRIQNLNDHTKLFNYWAGELDKQVEVNNGDLLFAWSGTPGTSFGAHIWDRGKGVLNQHIFRVDLDRSYITTQWAKYTVNQQLNRLIDFAHGGVGLKHVTKGVVQELKIPLPPISEQKRIAAILDKADALREKRRQAIAKLDELLQSVFLDTFGDPVANPKSLKTQTLEELFDFQTGRIDSNAMEEDGIYPFFTCSKQDFRINQYAFDCEALLLAGNNASADYSVKHYKGKFNAYQRTYVLTLKNSFNSYRYFKICLEMKLLDLKRLSKGTNTKYLTLGILKPLKVLIPSPSEQIKFEEVSQRVLGYKKTHENSHQKIENLFASLQQRAFRGKL